MKAEFPIPAEFPPGAEFFVDDGDPVVWLPEKGYCSMNVNGLMVPREDFARTSPPSEIKESEWRERAGRYVEYLRA